MPETNQQKILRALLAPMPDIERAALQALTEMNVNTAVGIHLDRIGYKVGREREGVTDDEIYRRYIRAQIAANKSDGLIADMLTIARLVVFDDDATYLLRNEGAAAFVLVVEGVAVAFEVAEVLADLIRLATAAGVRGITQTQASEPEDAFTFEGGDGLPLGSLPELDLAPLTANVDTVVRHRDPQLATLALVADGTGAGSLTNVGNAWTFHFESGVTTVAQFETAINASSALVVLTTDGVGTLDAGDVIAATTFTRPVTGGTLASWLI